MSNVTIRPAKTDDAQSLLDLWHVLDKETEFLLYEPMERHSSLEEQRSRIAKADNSSRVHILLAIDNDTEELIGVAAGRRSELKRDEHNLELIVAIKQKNTGKGIGQKLLEQLEVWAKSKNVHRIELAVMVNNSRAIKLYEKCGFKMEGTKTDAVKLQSGYVDLHMMAKIIS